MLHIVSNLDALKQATEYASSKDEFLLVQNAVYAVNPKHFAHSKLNAHNSFALSADVEARGLLEKADSAIELVDFAGFVDLTAEHSKSITW
ncbi:tRNA 5-methylaminomethyl-2-thiouridine synthase tusB [Vibrio sp. JCM 19236]|nr:tRNA 5-methylaminomethyl-2-thiouridine synthase tusB [Vibrio sp. JCM 19236]